MVSLGDINAPHQGILINIMWHTPRMPGECRPSGSGPTFTAE